jgi:hypothetical protein
MYVIGMMLRIVGSLMMRRSKILTIKKNMKNFCLIASIISGILFTASIAGLGTIENLIAFGVLDILFYQQYLVCKIDELKKR